MSGVIEGLKFGYKNSVALMQEHLEKCGEMLPKSVVVEIPLATLKPDARALWKVDGRGGVNILFAKTYNRETCDEVDWEASVKPVTGADAFVTWRKEAEADFQAALVKAKAILAERIAALGERVPNVHGRYPEMYSTDGDYGARRLLSKTAEREEYEEAVAAWNERSRAAHAHRVVLDERTREAAEARKAKEEADAEKRKAEANAEREAWVKEHGSLYLEMALREGYSCQRTYVTERAAKEHPDYKVDFKNSLAFEERANPSPCALAQAIADKARVVWATAPPNKTTTDEDDYYAEPYQPREMLVIADFLGKYTLVRETWEGK